MLLSSFGSNFMRVMRTVRKDWNRRWFELANGTLSYFKNTEDKLGIKVCDILLSTVRPVTDKANSKPLPYAFEILSANNRRSNFTFTYHPVLFDHYF
jgi:hypothetical protein